MSKSYLSKCVLLFLCCAYLNFAYSYYPSSTKNNSISLSDEIKQSENKATQEILDRLNANSSSENNSAQQHKSSNSEKPSEAASIPRSNTDKAFVPSDNKPASSSTNKNPWLQPNPWAKQPPNIWGKNARVNPYSNAPIPGPGASTSTAVLSPPNIFLPSRAAPTQTNQNQSNANF